MFIMEIGPELKKSLIRYAFVSFIFVIGFTILVAKEGGAGTGKTILFFFAMALFGTPCGAVGGAIGNAIRLLTRPDAIITTGGLWPILMQKVFWSVGPQYVGIFVGTFIPFFILMRLLGIG